MPGLKSEAVPIPRIAAGTRSWSVESSGQRAWASEAVAKLLRESRRTADTSLIEFPLPPDWGVSLYLKDESTQPTGSLKHRLARDLFLYALCNGWIDSGTTIIEASSGSTAVSVAYFARILGLKLVAVVPKGTSTRKIELIESYGGECHLVDGADQTVSVARQLAVQCDGHYLDQFTYAERVVNWSGGNIAESIFRQMSDTGDPIPQWIVVGAGTGGTSATVGRFMRFKGIPTRLCVADPDGSAYFDSWATHADSSHELPPIRIEGIGRPSPEPSFIPQLVDRMIQVPDAASIAATRFLFEQTGRRAGGSSGTNLWAALELVAELVARNETGSIVTLVCDVGDRYLDTYYDDAWLAAEGIDLQPHADVLKDFITTGEMRTDREINGVVVPVGGHTDPSKTDAPRLAMDSEPRQA